MSIAYDWKDSTNAFEGDKAKWDELFRLPDGPVSRWKEARGAERMVALDDMVKGVKATQWWARYTGQIKGGVKVECQHGSKVELLCIEGGPISQVESKEMAALVAEIKEDLRP